jgi:hypothetical protein
MSATFTEFYRRVLPLSESLPQVVHHQESIMSLLEEYISRQDSLAQHSLLEYNLVEMANWQYAGAACTRLRGGFLRQVLAAILRVTVANSEPRRLLGHRGNSPRRYR